nr:GlsB/YeaQ/YmgE family stress response membrane protein [Propionicimonas sp.]
MAFIPWIIMGLIAAAVAKSIMDVRAGWLPTVLLAIAGSTVAGWMGALLTGNSDLPFFSLGSWVLAILGSVIVLWVFNRLTGRSKA